MADKGSVTTSDDRGLIASARGLVVSVIAALETRLALLGTELQEERIRVTRLVIWGTLGLFCLFQGITLLAVFTVILFWESNRLAVLGLMCGGFLGIGIVIAVGLAVSARSPKHHPIASTLEVLANDRQHLESSK
jgi:uncharacterized membrane protein YqjE